MGKRSSIASTTRRNDREAVAVIGGGIAGCLSALMLEKAGYHVTLIEKNEHLLEGTSKAAARLHLGGEYPLDAETAEDCLRCAVTAALVLPDHIYTQVKPTKFLVSEETQKSGKLTVDMQLQAYEKVREKYEELFKLVQTKLELTEEETASRLFGSYKEGEFYYKLLPHEYADYIDIAGGFQSRERGINIPKFLGTIQYAVENNPNIEILTNHAVTPHKSRDKHGIRGELGDFQIYCKEEGKKNARKKVIGANQVVLAAASGGPAIIPQLTYEGEQAALKVYRRAMMMVDLPDDFQTDSAFVMLGYGMVSVFDIPEAGQKRVAFCYLPDKAAAYIDEKLLTYKDPALPANWELLYDSRERTDYYFQHAKDLFPVLKNATNPRLLLGDAVNFQKVLEQRKYHSVKETEMPPAMEPKLSMEMRAVALQLITQDLRHRAEYMEISKGLWQLMPTKLTYAPDMALQLTMKAILRSQKPDLPPISTIDVLPTILNNPTLREKFSLKDLPLPPREYFDEVFFKQHRDLRPAMLGQYAPAQAKSPKSEAAAQPEADMPNLHKKGRDRGKSL